MISESVNFGGDVFVGTDTLVTDAVYETTLGYGAFLGARTGYSGVSSSGNVV